MKTSFRPCNMCSLPCEKAKGTPPKNIPLIEREKEKQKIKENGCPYVVK